MLKKTVDAVTLGSASGLGKVTANIGNVVEKAGKTVISNLSTLNKKSAPIQTQEVKLRLGDDLNISDIPRTETPNIEITDLKDLLERRKKEEAIRNATGTGLKSIESYAGKILEELDDIIPVLKKMSGWTYTDKAIADLKDAYEEYEFIQTYINNVLIPKIGEFSPSIRVDDSKKWELL